MYEANLSQYELDRKIEELDKQGKRKEVVELMRKYGLFIDETAVNEYLRGR